MGVYHINGGRRLNGQLNVYGGKNAILPILASVILNGSESIIHNCPKISDTDISIKILEELGCAVKYDGYTMSVDSSSADIHSVSTTLMREMRSSFIFLGGLLGRFHEVTISYPGGCELGERPINLHLEALRKMGAEITEASGFIKCKADDLKGARIDLSFPSVGATENIMLTAVLAQGETIIGNAAREPEIEDLQKFLNGMGAKVAGAGTSQVRIQGVKSLHRVEHTVMPDRIVAGTFLVAAAITGGKILLKNAAPEHMFPITYKLSEAGCTLDMKEGSIYLEAPAKIRPIELLRTHPHPGFPTDMQPQFMSLLTLASGVSVISETVFESRNKHVAELKRMGANIILAQDGTTAVIKGVGKLHGAVVESKDLRGGAALILAGLAAEGKTTVTRSRFVERGYIKIEQDLAKIGADITYEKADDKA
ncbi:MAG: UDP-N-acetylglucosamine 1-carboxyvinyltransferase [Clostridiales bacterium]|jgi:UDP-N-acetylglucosamine 1-carboxyvinyltransferase|nr:UDP-N-acetylglucosamine 1-carboxyvinyltransferase [Clostridiales bacterium]